MRHMQYKRLFIGVALMGPTLLSHVNEVLAGPFDGTYTGTFRAAGGSSSGCGPMTAKMTISGSKLTLTEDDIRGQTFLTITTDVAGNGAFQGSGTRNMGGRTAPVTMVLSGTVTANGVEADSSGNRCKYHLSMKKS